MRYNLSMRFSIKVVPRAKQIGVVPAAEGTWVVRVREPAVDGRANVAVIAALAEHFNVKARAVTIVHGQTSRRKLVAVNLP